MHHKKQLLMLLIFGLVFLVVTACNRSTTSPSIPPVTEPPVTVPAESATPVLTPTTALPSVPLAVLLNDEAILLSEFQAELERYLASQGQAGTEASPETRQQVLDDLINRTLLAQQARLAGFTLDDAALQARIEALVAQAGGPEAFSAYLADHGYSEADFELALKREVEAAWMRDQIAAGVPDTAEQTHARQILLYNVDQANEVLERVEAGEDFERLAAVYDPFTGGELGWFPRGYLTELAVEEAAFALQPGEVSGVIQTRLGYHIIQIVDRDSARALDFDARRALQAQALQQWLDDKRSQSAIQILLP